MCGWKSNLYTLGIYSSTQYNTLSQSSTTQCNTPLMIHHTHHIQKKIILKKNCCGNLRVRYQAEELDYVGLLPKLKPQDYVLAPLKLKQIKSINTRTIPRTLNLGSQS